MRPRNFLAIISAEIKSEVIQMQWFVAGFVVAGSMILSADR